MQNDIQLGDMLVTVDDVSERLGSYNDFYNFRAWVVEHVAKGELVEFKGSGVPIYLWDRRSEGMFPHLLIHQEWGQYLPMEDISPQPLIGSSIRLLEELEQIEPHRLFMPDHLKPVFDGLLKITRRSVKEFKIMELNSIALNTAWE